MLKLLIPLALTGAVIVANAGAKPYEAAQMRQSDIIQKAAISVPFAEQTKPKITAGAKIGIARMDKGRLIAAPLKELRYWARIDNSLPVTFSPVSPAAHIKTLPEIPLDGRDSDNRIDEIRLTAATLGMDYVLIYVMGADAKTGKFGHKQLMQTGLEFDKNDKILLGAAPAKAVLVNTYSGKVIASLKAKDMAFPTGEIGLKLEAIIRKMIIQNPQNA